MSFEWILSLSFFQVDYRVLNKLSVWTSLSELSIECRVNFWLALPNHKQCQKLPSKKIERRFNLHFPSLLETPLKVKTQFYHIMLRYTIVLDGHFVSYTSTNQNPQLNTSQIQVVTSLKAQSTWLAPSFRSLRVFLVLSPSSFLLLKCLNLSCRRRMEGQEMVLGSPLSRPFVAQWIFYGGYGPYGLQIFAQFEG